MICAAVEHPVFVYTVTAGLGDLVVMGTVARWIEESLPGAECCFIHRDNPHTPLWQGVGAPRQFYNVYSCIEMFRFIRKMRKLRQGGRIVFGLQMAPGSVQGFIFLRFLHKLGVLDYVVDFNLVNADIVTPPRGEYILDWHLNQVLDLLKSTARVPTRPMLPFAASHMVSKPGEELHVGLHPWSRRGHQGAFVWQESKWFDLIRYLVRHPHVAKVIVFGRDKKFDCFRNKVLSKVNPDKLCFKASDSVPKLAETIAQLDLLVTVNTGVVHIAHAIDIPMIILNGPSLDLWVPKGEKIVSLRDQQAFFQAPDRAVADERFSQVGNIKLDDVTAAVEKALLQGMAEKEGGVRV